MEKVGNLEKKLYRATALWYEVPQFFQPASSDPCLRRALDTYRQIRHETNAILSTFNRDIPEEGDPTDFAVYANIQAFMQTFEKASTKANMQKIKLLLENFDSRNLHSDSQVEKQ
jgi:hypothetical protein